MDYDPSNSDKDVGCIQIIVLVNHRNREIENRKSFNTRVFCYVIRCTYNQFKTGAPYEEAVKRSKLFIHKELKLSSEDFDFLAYDRTTGHFINKKVWKMDNWEDSEILDISDKVIETEE
jgi:hypothetical protein